MQNKQVFRNLSLYICASATQILQSDEEFDRLCETIFRILFYKVYLPKKAFQLISDKRYHTHANIAYGFQYHMSTYKNSSTYYYLPLLNEICNKIQIRYLYKPHKRNLVFHALIILFFEDNPQQLDLIEPNPNIHLLENLYATHPKKLGERAN